MSLNLPTDITNIIFDYVAQLKNLKWIPYVDKKSGKLRWKYSKYKKYVCDDFYIIKICNEFPKINICIEDILYLKTTKLFIKKPIDLTVIIYRFNQLINEYFINGYLVKFRMVDSTPFCERYKSDYYFEFTDENGNNLYLYRKIGSPGDVYMDNTLYGELLDFRSDSLYNFGIIRIDKF